MSIENDQAPLVVNEKKEDGGFHYARTYHLWAMGVGAVIGGDFFGWQSCLSGGFLGACICLAIVTVLYVLLSLCVAELAAFKPDAGGPYTYVTELLGDSAGFLTGLAECLKVVTCVSVGLFAIGSYMVQVTGTDQKWQPLWWLGFLLAFTVLNIVGLKFSFNVEFVFTMMSLLVLIVFYLGAIPKFDFNKWVLGNCDNESSNSTCPTRWVFPNGMSGLSDSISFSLWFYLGVEEIPMVTGDTSDASKIVPRGIMATMGTLVLLSTSTLLFASSIEPGAYKISTDNSPLLTGYKTIFNQGSWFDYVSWVIVIGFVASCQSFILCTGRLVYAIARDGLFPEPLSRLHPKTNTPYISLITSSVISYAIVSTLYFLLDNDDKVGFVLINLSLFGALISYVLQCVSHIRLSLQHPNRTCYRSPFGIAGTVLCLLLCILVYCCIIAQGVTNTSYIFSVVGGTAVLATGMAIYLYRRLFRKKRDYANLHANEQHIK